MPIMQTDFNRRALAATRACSPMEIWTPVGAESGIDGVGFPFTARQATNYGTEDASWAVLPVLTAGAAAVAGGSQSIAATQAFPALNVEATLTLQAAGSGMMVATGTPAVACCPIFYQSNVAGLYDIEIKGLNQFGERLTYRVSSAAILEFRGVIPCFSKYDYIKVTPRNASAAAPETISVGWTCPASTIPTKLPLPYKPRARTDVIQTATTQVSLDTPQFLMCVDNGGGRFAAPANGIVEGALEAFIVAQTDIEHAVIGVRMGAIIQNRKPMRFLCFMDPEAIQSGRF